MEGFARNLFNLKYFIDKLFPDFIFISEPQAYENDLNLIMKPLSGEYQASLNSGDIYDPCLPLHRSKAHGGTLVLWKFEHDPYITVWPVTTTSFLPILFHPPGSALTVHVAVYLPTAGQDALFLDELSKLSDTLDEINAAHPNAPFFLRGDFNVSERNIKRTEIFKYFCQDYNLQEVPIPHPTYHHFVGDTSSSLDKLLVTNDGDLPEVLVHVHCKLQEPLVDSHHDLIVSSWKLPTAAKINNSDENIVAPQLPNNRLKIFWSDEGIEEYQQIVVPHLTRIQELWLSSPTKATLSLLLNATSNLLTSSAALTNRFVSLDLSSKPRHMKTIPKFILKSRRNLLKMNRLLQQAKNRKENNVGELLKAYNAARMRHRSLHRQYKAEQAWKRDHTLYSVCTKDPSVIFKSIKSVKRGSIRKIQKLTVGKKVYVGDSVKDGFFDSISQLKSRDPNILAADSKLSSLLPGYKNILEICKNGPPIPTISEIDSFKLLQKMKPSVSDVDGLTINHYKYAGPAGWKHFNLLLNSLICDVNNTDIEEVNTAYAVILFKGHKKDRSSDKSYRLISSCPVIAKALDLHIRDAEIKSWNVSQASTQFQGEGSSHELAAVLLTESIQHSLTTLKQPIYILYLDAESAFDVVLHEILVTHLFNTGTSGHNLLFINNRLSNRRTVVDWEGNLLGPIQDERGLEQGGVKSSDLYKIFAKEQITTAQESGLGVDLGPVVVSAIGQADDTALISNSIHKLQHLLYLSEVFCKKHHVTLSAKKTKLQVFATKDMEKIVQYSQNINPLKLNDNKIEFKQSIEHVGMLRSSLGNTPTILDRLTAHRNALRAVLHTGMARGHRGNPAASLHVDKIYGIPVLLSGLGPLVLSRSDLQVINQHHKEIVSSLQRLLPNTPRSVIYFLGGSLPAEGLLHIRQLSIFGMISRLPSSHISQVVARHLLSSLVPMSKSWISQIVRLCQQYGLPSPLQLLQDPLPKLKFKTLVKAKVTDYWEKFLRSESSDPKYSSLTYFKPNFMSLSSPHPAWTTASSSPSRVAMATIQVQMLSGRYRSESLCRYWSSNRGGFCLISPACAAVKEDIPHILAYCPVLAPVREKLVRFTSDYCYNSFPPIFDVITNLCIPSNPNFVQFLLDCSVLPEVILAKQVHGSDVLYHLFHITRTWVYTLHKTRLKLLGRWNFV